VPANESTQLRLGLGQVLDYRYALAQHHHRVEAVLMVERETTPGPVVSALPRLRRDASLAGLGRRVPRPHGSIRR